MLNIFIPGGEFYDDDNNMFVTKKAALLTLEHSLYSISKWESKHHKSFFSEEDKEKDEILDYIRCMTVYNSEDDDSVYTRLTQEDINKISSYMTDPMTATTFQTVGSSNKEKKIVTSELLYYSMIINNIPFECDKWHINRLKTLIRVCQIKNNPPEKMSAAEQAAYQRDLNERRKKQFNTRG